MYKGLSRFREAVMEAPSLQAQLREADDPEEFARKMVELGADRGYSFDEEDVKEALRASRREWMERKIR